jgi:hypothetical protein
MYVWGMHAVYIYFSISNNCVLCASLQDIQIFKKLTKPHYICRIIKKKEIYYIHFDLKFINKWNRIFVAI